MFCSSLLLVCWLNIVGMIGDRNSKQASEYAAKKKLALQRANQLRAERKALEDREKYGSLNQNRIQGTERDKDRETRNDMNVFQSSRNNMNTDMYVNINSNDHSSSSYAEMKSNMKMATSDYKQQQPQSQPQYDQNINNQFQLQRTNTNTNRRSQPQSRLQPSSSSSSSSSSRLHVSRPRANHYQQPQQLIKTDITVGEAALRNTTVSDVGTRFFSSDNGNNIDTINTSIYTQAPIAPQGSMFDVSDLMILCTASKPGEVVVGTADHALYSLKINERDTTQSIVTKMYPKRSGHTEWVTGVGFLADNRVVSCGMDSRLCVWSTDRRTCTDIVHAHAGSISTIVTDQKANLAITCGYDKKINVWCFGQGGNRVPKSPSLSLSGHENAIITLRHAYGLIASGARDGALYLWDLESQGMSSRYRAHKGQLSCMTVLSASGYRGNSSSSGSSSSSSCLIATGGTDGVVKLWDSRAKGSICSAPVHAPGAVSILEGLGDYSNISNNINVSNDNGSENNGGIVAPSDLHLLTGGADNTGHLLEARMGWKPLFSWQHARNCIYSAMTMTGSSSNSSSINGCAFIGDGEGMMYCYDLKDGQLKYGLGASSQGAVRCITMAGEKLVACGEDGNILVYDH